MPGKLQRRLFLVLWGGWTVAAAAWALAATWEPTVGWVLLLLAWISLAGEELNFRQAVLPRNSHKPLHAWAVLLVMTVPASIGLLEPKLSQFLPERVSYRQEKHFKMRSNVPGKDFVFVAHCGWYRLYWAGSVRSAGFFKTRVYMRGPYWGKKGAVWIIDHETNRAYPADDPSRDFEFDRAGSRIIFRHLAGNRFEESLINDAGDVLRHALMRRTPPSPSLESPYIVGNIGSGETNSLIPWPWLLAACFSISLAPVTWAVVRFTMVPPDHADAQ